MLAHATVCTTIIWALLTQTAWSRDLWCDNRRDLPVTVGARLGEIARKSVGAAPNAAREIRTEGLLPGQGLYDVSMKSKEDFRKALGLAYGWRTQHKQVYRDSARRFVVAWARTYRPDFNPIDETDFTQLFETYAAIKDDLSESDRQLVDRWLRKFHDGHVAELRRREAAHEVQTSNWQSHRIKIATGAAIAIGDMALVSAVEPFYQAQLRANIHDDGSIEDFHTRDSLGYAVYSLRPLVETALITRAAGAQWLPPGSTGYRRLIGALDWMLPFVTGTKTHIEYVHSTVHFDRVRERAGVKGYGHSAWKPANARDLFWLAAYLDPKYISVASSLHPKPASFLVACRGTVPTSEASGARPRPSHR